MKKKPSLWIQGVIFFLYVILGVTIVIPLLITAIIYEAVFGSRCTPIEKIVTEKDYPQLVKRSVAFRSGRNRLHGGIFTNKNNDGGKAVIVLGHGIGCGMNNYMNRIDYFARKGYTVFAYDVTGCCASGGKSIKGLPQAQIDMYRAVRYVAEAPEFAGQRILIYGHSWSGYAAATVLNRKFVRQRVTACATMSGFNDNWGIIKDQGSRYVGKAVVFMKPFCYLYQFLKFGRSAFFTGIGGINRFRGKVLVMHSADDPTVKLAGSVYAAKDRCVNPNARFVLFEDRGHTLSRPIEAEAVIEKNFRAAKTRMARGKMNIFQYNVEIHYEHSDLETVYATDEGFMDQAEAFFAAALK